MSFSNYQQHVIINDNLLAGVQSVDGSYSINEKPINIAGVGFVNAFVNSPMVGNFNITRLMTGPDPLLEKNIQGKYKFDEEDVIGEILYDESEKGFGFTKGRVSSYSVTCNVGDIPEIKTSIIVYGNMGANVANVLPYNMLHSNRYYPYQPGNEYTNPEVYLGTRVSANLVTSDWNSGTLSITFDQYQALPNYSKSEWWATPRGGVRNAWLLLGKDAFSPYKVGGESNSQLNESEIQYPDQSSIKITVNDFQIDPITSFSFTRTINTKPTYALPKGALRGWDDNTGPSHDNLTPIQIDTMYPIETDFNLSMIAEEYEIREIKDRLQSAPTSNISVDICDAFNHDLVINQLKLYNVRLIGETINSSVGGELSISMTYKVFETKNR